MKNMKNTFYMNFDSDIVIYPHDYFEQAVAPKQGFVNAH